jgi:hypothetical protein
VVRKPHFLRTDALMLVIGTEGLVFNVNSPLGHPAMVKAKSACAAKAKGPKLRKKLVPHAQWKPGPTTTHAYIHAHLQSASTIWNYNSAINGAQTWLKLNCTKYTALNVSSVSGNGTEDQVDKFELGLFQHKNVHVAFEKPVEVTAHLLAKYIMFRVTEEDRSVSVVDTLRSAFKWHFRNLSVFTSVRALPQFTPCLLLAPQRI